MRALTLTQPWAGLVASGIKLFENRPRSMIRRVNCGKSFAIHASREIVQATYDRIYQIAPELLGRASIDEDAGAAKFRLAPDHAAPWYRMSRITSAVVAIATIDKVFDGGWDAETIAKHADTLSDSRGELLGPQQVRWFFGPVGYLLRDVVALSTPVPCRGWQGFWTLPTNIERAVMEQIPRDEHATAFAEAAVADLEE